LAVLFKSGQRYPTGEQAIKETVNFGPILGFAPVCNMHWGGMYGIVHP
jgi:hypothetical protein